MIRYVMLRRPTEFHSNRTTAAKDDVIAIFKMADVRHVGCGTGK